MNLLPSLKTAGSLALLLLILAPLPSRAGDPVDLRGYGKVSADVTPGRSEFDCESVEKADILLDKLQADLFWDNTFPVQKTSVKVGPNTVTVFSLDGYGAAVIARSGKRVVVIGGTDEAQAAALAAKEPLLLADDVTSQAAKPHPFFLDYFDNKAFKAYVQPMKSGLGFGIESHWPFLKQFGACEACFGPFFHNESPAPGVIDWTSEDYEIQEAARQNDMTVVGPDGGGEVPLWVANWAPGTMMKPSDTTLLGDWGNAGMAGAHYEAWSTPVKERSLTGLGFLQQVMQRYGSSPNVGGWMLFAGSPGVEYNFHGRAMHSWDTSDAGQAGWRSWLRDEKQWSLADLGTRWYGDSGHFSSWDEVKVPDLNQFFGALGDDSFRVDSGWKWEALAQAVSSPIAPDAPGWVPVDRPPSQQQAFISRTGFNYFDVSFDPTDWLKKQKDGASTWLVFGMTGAGNKGVQVWFNDKVIDIPNDPASRTSSFAIPLTGLLTPGVNHLQVGLNCAQFPLCGGKLAGPVFLTTHEPKRAPYLGPQANALFADFVAWQCWALTDYHKKLLDLARKLDPDRPFVLSGGAEPLYNYTVKLAVDYGMGVENTGREASYRPWLPGLGMSAGFYSTSEWSATPLGDKLDQGFAWILYDGDCSHCLYHDIEAFQKREKEDGWFTRHARQIQLFGKYLQVQPGIALMLSAESDRLGAPPGNDVGRGEIEAAHYGIAYVTEDGVADGLADRYPVLFDTGSQFMEKATVAAIRKYVEKGGTFVALNNTGLDTALEPASYPLSGLSGFKVAGTGKHGKIRFESSLPIFKGWENKEFEGWGMAVDWLKEDHAKEGNLGLTPADDSAVPLARWDDGTVAIGYRKVGKGQIITLGSTFWRDGQDISGVWRTTHELEAQFFEKLFTDCGVLRNANASIPEVWAHKMVTKNGLQNWLISFNSTSEPHDADVWMSTDGQPSEVIDLETNAKVPFVYEKNGVTIQNVHFNSYEVKAYAVPRSTLAGGLPVWWAEKTTYWKRTPVEIAAADTALPEPNKEIEEPILPLKDWHFHTDEDHAIATKGDWMSANFDDSSWQVKNAGPWNYFDPALKDYHGTGLYRIKFTVPATWTGRRILLNLYDYDTPIVYDDGEFSINGTHIVSYKAHGWSQTLNYDVTGQVHPGENVLTLEDAGGPKLGGLGTGAIWIESRAPLAPVVDLSGTWQAVGGDWLTRTDVTVPVKAKVTARYLTRDISIPGDWKNKKVWLEWSTPNQWLGSVVINGHPIGYNGASHPFGLFSRINVTPFLKPGETNHLEIWPFITLPNADTNNPHNETSGFQLDSIDIGCQ